jgi:predicted PurR-regulated permease PerM
MPRKIEISYKTIVFTVLFIISLGFLYWIRDIIIQVFVALLITTILNPSVTRLQKYKVPRAVSILIIYLMLLALMIFAVATLVPALVDQTTKFTSAIPQLMGELNIPIEVVDQLTVELTSQLSNLPSQVVRISVSIFSNVVSFLAIFILALYFLLAWNKLPDYLLKFLPNEQVAEVDRIISRIEKDLGGWARGQIILMFIVGLATYIGLLILGIPYALPLAVLAGMFELVPNLGPFLAAVPAVLVGLGISPLTGLAVAALGFLIQQIENYVFVPKIMQRSAHVSPVVTLLSIVIGFRVAGVTGAILSIPLVIILRVLFTEYWAKKTS